MGTEKDLKSIVMMETTETVMVAIATVKLKKSITAKEDHQSERATVSNTSPTDHTSPPQAQSTCSEKLFRVSD